MKRNSDAPDENQKGRHEHSLSQKRIHLSLAILLAAIAVAVLGLQFSGSSQGDPSPKFRWRALFGLQAKSGSPSLASVNRDPFGGSSMDTAASSSRPDEPIPKRGVVERQRLEFAVKVVREKFREIERRNCEVAAEQNDGLKSVLALRIREPSVDDLSEISEAITLQHRILQGTPNETLFTDKTLELWKSFTGYPEGRPYKMVVMHAYDREKSASPVPVLVSVGYSASPDELLPDANGAVTFRDCNRGSRDGWVPSKSSWTKDRYGYLFEIEPNSTGKAPSPGRGD